MVDPHCYQVSKTLDGCLTHLQVPLHKLPRLDLAWYVTSSARCVAPDIESLSQSSIQGHRVRCQVDFARIRRRTREYPACIACAALGEPLGQGQVAIHMTEQQVWTHRLLSDQYRKPYQTKQDDDDGLSSNPTSSLAREPRSNTPPSRSLGRKRVSRFQ